MLPGHLGRCPTDAVEHRPYVIHPPQSTTLGSRIAWSEKWIPGSRPTKVRVRGVPYITSAGHLTRSITSIWKGGSAQFFATTCRLVFNKLRRRTSKWNEHAGRKGPASFLMKVAIFYAICQDSRKLERLIHANQPHRLLMGYTAKMDEQLRFLFGQACLHADWLQLRGPKPRAQSISRCFLPQYRRIGLRSYSAGEEIRSALSRVTDPWICHGR